MGGKGNSLLVGALVVLIALGLAACGGGDATTDGGGDQASATAGQDSTERTDGGGDGKPEAGEESKGGTNSGDSGGQESSPDSGGGESGSGEPDGSSGGGGGGDSNGSGNGGGSDGNGKKPNKTSGPLEKAGKKESAEIREFGTVTDDSEMQAAHEVLIAYARAFNEKNWTVACGTLSKEMIDSLEQLAKANSDIKGTSCLAAFSYVGELGILPNLGTDIADPLDGFQVEGNGGWAIYGGEAFVMPMTREGGEWKLNAFEPKKLT